MQGGSLHLALSYICSLLKLQIQNELSFQNLKKKKIKKKLTTSCLLTLQIAEGSKLTFNVIIDSCRFLGTKTYTASN